MTKKKISCIYLSVDSTENKLPTKEEIKIWLDKQVEKGYIKDKETWVNWQFNAPNAQNVQDGDNIYSQLSDNESTLDENVVKHFYECMNPKYVKLFYYASSTVACKIIESGQLKGTDPRQTNDPFEFMPKGLGPISFHNYDLQILCFSRTITSAAMWGHYGEQHKGVCFVFNVPLVAYKGATTNQCHWRIASMPERTPTINCLYKVNYSKKRKDLHNNFNKIEDFFCTKDKSWSWEEEIRMICDVDDCDEVDAENRVFYKFPMNYLESIVCGVRNTNMNRLKYLCKTKIEREIIFDKCTYSEDKFEVGTKIASNTDIEAFPKTYYQKCNAIHNSEYLIDFICKNMNGVECYY